MPSTHGKASGTSCLENAIADVVREAALVGATITITVSPVLPIPAEWSPRGDQTAVVDPPDGELDPPDVEADLIRLLRDAPGEQLTVQEFAKLLGHRLENTRDDLLRAWRLPDSVKDWLYSRCDTRTVNGGKIRTYRLTDAGRKIVLSGD